MEQVQTTSEQQQRERWQAYQRWLVRWLAVLMGGSVLTLIGGFVWAVMSFGPHLEPRWEWVWSAGHYEHILEALDAHEPGWTDPSAIAERLRHANAAQPVDWVRELAPVSKDYFLVTDPHEMSFSLFASSEANIDFWAQYKVRHQAEVEFPKAAVTVKVAADLPPGRHAVVFPSAFHALDEIVVLFRTLNSSIEPWFAGFGPACLLIARPRVGEVEVTPLDWWNENPRFGPHNDIERLFRDPVSGRLFGDGSHLRPFVLKEDPREVEAWLR